MGAALEDRVRALVASGRKDQAATLVLRTLRGKVFGFLCAVLDEDDAQDAYSLYEENLWLHVEDWRGEGTVRSWAYAIAWNAVKQLRRDPYWRRRQRLPSSLASRLPARVRSTTREMHGGRHDRLRSLREVLTPEEQSLLVLRIDRGLDWEEAATVLRIPAATLRKRYERLKAKLTNLARRKGLVE